jgi:exonuclease VII large subunit
VKKEDEIIKKAQQLNAGDEIKIKLAEGEVRAKTL